MSECDYCGDPAIGRNANQSEDCGEESCHLAVITDPVLMRTLHADTDDGRMFRESLGLRLDTIGSCFTGTHTRVESVGDWCSDDEILIVRAPSHD